jgi:outer membrane protein assembly factor BamB
MKKNLCAGLALSAAVFASLLSLSVGAVAQTFYGSSVDWPQLHFSAPHSGFNPLETTLSPKTVPGLKKAWTLTTGGPINGGIAESNGLLYFGTQLDDKAYAVNASTGAVRWVFPTAGYVFTSPAVVGGVVYLSSAGNRFADIYALNAKTGKLIWTYHVPSVPGYLADPIVDGGLLYVDVETFSGDEIFAFDALTGAVHWTVQLPSLSGKPPAAVGGAVYVGAYNGSVYALKASDGSIKWAISVGKSTGGLSVSGTRVYVGGADGTSNTLYALNAKTGSKVWSFPVVNRRTVGFSDPTLANGKLYVAGGEGNGIAAYALNATTGSRLWTTALVCCNVNSAAVANGVVYLTSNDQVIAFDAGSGKQLWQSSHALSPFIASPTVVNGMVFAGSSDSNVYAFHLRSSAGVQ